MIVMCPKVIQKIGNKAIRAEEVGVFPDEVMARIGGWTLGDFIIICWCRIQHLAGMKSTWNAPCLFDAAWFAVSPCFISYGSIPGITLSGEQAQCRSCNLARQADWNQGLFRRWRQELRHFSSYLIKYLRNSKKVIIYWDISLLFALHLIASIYVISRI